MGRRGRAGDPSFKEGDTPVVEAVGRPASCPPCMTWQRKGSAPFGDVSRSCACHQRHSHPHRLPDAYTEQIFLCGVQLQRRLPDTIHGALRVLEPQCREQTLVRCACVTPPA